MLPPLQLLRVQPLVTPRRLRPCDSDGEREELLGKFESTPPTDGPERAPLSLRLSFKQRLPLSPPEPPPSPTFPDRHPIMHLLRVGVSSDLGVALRL